MKVTINHIQTIIFMSLMAIYSTHSYAMNTAMNTSSMSTSASAINTTTTTTRYASKQEPSNSRDLTMLALENATQYNVQESFANQYLSCAVLSKDLKAVKHALIHFKANPNTPCTLQPQQSYASTLLLPQEQAAADCYNALFEVDSKQQTFDFDAFNKTLTKIYNLDSNARRKLPATYRLLQNFDEKVAETLLAYGADFTVTGKHHGLTLLGIARKFLVKCQNTIHAKQLKQAIAWFEKNKFPEEIKKPSL